MKLTGPGNWGNKLFRIPQNSYQSNKIFNREYPGRYRVKKIAQGVTTYNDQPLEQHEATHFSIFDIENGELIALLTSAKGGDGFKLDDIKMDGSFVAMTDKDGNIVPNPAKGGQWIRFYKNVRVVSNRELSSQEFPKGDYYLEKHQNMITTLSIKENIEERPRRVLKYNFDLLNTYKDDSKIKLKKNDEPL